MKTQAVGVGIGICILKLRLALLLAFRVACTLVRCTTVVGSRRMVTRTGRRQTEPSQGYVLRVGEIFQQVRMHHCMALRPESD